jgi:hypothetical protein
MADHVVIDGKGNIINSIVLEDGARWSPPEGCMVAVGEYEIGGTYISGVYTPPPAPPPPPLPPATILPQDLMAQFTAGDAGKIQTAVNGNAQQWLLWQAFTAQRDPMVVPGERFLAGWNALVGILGQDRMNAIAAALKITV